MNDNAENIITIETLAEEARSFLTNIGYDYEHYGDNWMLLFCCEKVTNTIQNECNVIAIPKGLKNIAVEMCVGEFLYKKKNTGQTEGFIDIDFGTAIKSIQEGDTNITFAIGEGSLTPEQAMNNFINYLLMNGRSEFVRYRKLQW